jgi:Pyruvate/2-oxoglutarate dehydrogenase complex, dehydrogenase (E1) component, eukaryotic type, beta subunit
MVRGAGEHGSLRELSYVEAINEAMREEMRRDPSVFLMGEDVRRGYGGGIFGASKGLHEEFGDERVIDTPLSEVAIGGCAAGAAWMGMRPIAEFQFADFVAIAFDQIVNCAAKFRWASEGKWGCPVVYRAPYGGRVGAGLNHSQSPEAWLGNVPGLTIVMPSTPYDAKGLLKTAIRADDPVVFLESKYLYRRVKGEVPDSDEYLVPLGKGDIKRAGDDLTIVAIGAMVYAAIEAADILAAEDGVSAEILDPRTVLPLDEELILASVEKTGKVVIVHEAPKRGGLGGEIAALIAEHGMGYLDSPVLRVGAPFTPVPANRNLDRDHFVPTPAKIVAAARTVLSGKIV